MFKKTFLIGLLFAFAMTFTSTEVSAQKRKSSYHSGHYKSGKGSSHKGGSYKNSSTSNHYRKRKH
jgi:hypothetical protein